MFTRWRVAVFIDGDFWHGYKFEAWACKLSPHWREKIAGNVARDRRNIACLRRAGWTVIRVWEHEVRRDASAVADRIVKAVRERAAFPVAHHAHPKTSHHYGKQKP